MNCFIHPREWLSMENHIRFLPGDIVSGEVKEENGRYFVIVDSDERVEVLKPGGHYSDIIRMFVH